jgi:hypothetical protein
LYGICTASTALKQAYTFTEIITQKRFAGLHRNTASSCQPRSCAAAAIDPFPARRRAIPLFLKETNPYNPPSFEAGDAMMKTLGKLTMAAALLSLTGCFSLAPPQWGHPGTATEQQKRAIRFDPYPENDIGPATNTQPRDYVPLAEPARARWQRNNLVQ